MSVSKLVKELQQTFPTLDKKSVDMALAYLRYYGYLNGSEDKQDIIKATQVFQATIGIENDGLLGPKTIRATQYPRCGCKDVEFITESATGLSRWGIPRITWFIEDYLDEFSKEEMIALIKKGFDYTASRVQLDFEQVSSSNKANIVFTASNSPRDEMGKASGVLAWCELPPSDDFAGQIITCFDIAENWIGDRGGRGIRYFNVLMHEVCWGHGMGLSHSKRNNCLMSPFYSELVAYPVEPDDDTEMFKRYKQRTQPTPTPPTTPTPTPTETSVVITGKVDKLKADGWRCSKL